jgi:hypothetical protein
MVHHPQKRACEDWHKRPPVLDAHIYRGVSGQAVATKYLTCHWLIDTISPKSFRRGDFILSKKNSHTVQRRNLWPLDLCIKTHPTCRFQHSNPSNGPCLDAIKMDKESSPEQTERAIDSSRHAGSIVRISQFVTRTILNGVYVLLGYFLHKYKSYYIKSARWCG